jgi:ectoine hydroxylase-related dioxygenase (phytanoyl-CoA dioxygenase family)
MHLAGIIYLNDVPPQGASTVVWPGSHRKIEALAKSDLTHYELMQTLNAELGKLDLGDPIEIPGKRGDVLFYHYLCAHSGSRNATDTPRLALVHKW